MKGTFGLPFTIFEFGAVFIAISFYWKEGKSTLSVD